MPTVSSPNELIDAVESASSGDEIVAEPGTYDLGSQLYCDTPGVTIRARNDAVNPERSGFVSHITGGDGGNLIELRADDVTFRGFEVSGAGSKGIMINTTGGSGDWYQSPSGVEVAHCDVHDNYNWGIMTNSGSGHTIRDCHSHDNTGSGGNSDGFNGSNADGCLFLRCHAWNNSDDGFDMWSGTNHTIRNCFSTGSGPDGQAEFKLGRDGEPGGGHTVENCVAYDSDVIGFSWNQERDNTVTVRNCTAYNCSPDFRFEDTSHTVENSISATNDVTMEGAVDERNNTWNLGIEDPMFVSTDSSSPDFLRLAAGSPCIGAGLDGIDIGAFPADSADSGRDPADGDETDDPATSGTQVDGSVTLTAGDGERTTSPLETEHEGFNGAGYVNFESDADASVAWPLEVTAPGEYNFEIRYANGGTSDRTATLYVGDAGQEITFPQTGGWVEWSRLTGTVDLPSGSTELGIVTTGEDAGNIDRITLDPTDDGNSNDGDDSSRAGDTLNHGYALPDAGQSDWHLPLNANFEAIDRDVPVVDTEGAIAEYEAVEGSLYVALDTGAVYVGDGSQWNRLGTLS